MNTDQNQPEKKIQPTTGKEKREEAFDRRLTEGLISPEDHADQVRRLRQPGAGAKKRKQQRNYLRIAQDAGKVTPEEVWQIQAMIERNVPFREALEKLRQPADWSPKMPDSSVPAPTFGHRARTARETLGWTQDEASRKLGMSPRALRSYESGEVTPKAYEQAGILRMYQEAEQ